MVGGFPNLLKICRSLDVDAADNAELFRSRRYHGRYENELLRASMRASGFCDDVGYNAVRGIHPIHFDDDGTPRSGDGLN